MWAITTPVETLTLNQRSRARRFLDAHETDLGANLLIAEPFDPVVFDRTDTVDGLRLVAPSQAACDLLTGSGRMPSEARSC